MSSQFKAQFLSAMRTLLDFAKNPVQGMRHLPNWEWPFLLIVQGACAAAAGVGVGIVSKSISGIFMGLIFVPLSNALISAVIAGFFYYTFEFVFKLPVSFHRMYTHVFFAQLPALAVYVITPVLPPLALLGPAAAGILLVVGFTDNFGLDRKRAVRFLAILYGIFCLLWILNAINYRRQIQSIHDRATPESLDILERELKGE